jgi:transposase-like protein
MAGRKRISNTKREEIKALYAEGVPVLKISKEKGVSPSYIYVILGKQTTKKKKVMKKPVSMSMPRVRLSHEAMAAVEAARLKGERRVQTVERMLIAAAAATAHDPSIEEHIEEQVEKQGFFQRMFSF